MKTPQELNTPEKRKDFAALYSRVVAWSEEDSCFIGSLPEIDGWCTHAETIEECYANLAECALLAVEDYALGGVPLSPPGGCVVIPPNAFYYSKNAGGAVAKLRHKLKLSQAAFAAALGVSVSALSKWEQGIRKPDKASAKLLSIIEKHPEMLYC